MHDILKNLPKGLLADVKAMMEGTNKLDPVGKETKDIDNDGDTDSTDKYLHNRRKAISKAVKEEVVEEEVEQIDELSKATLVSYKNKAAADPAFEKRKGKVSHVRKAIMAKRNAGLERAGKKITKHSEAEWKDMVKKRVDMSSKIHDHFNKTAPKILAKHGYSLTSDGSKYATYSKPHPTGHQFNVTLAKHRSASDIEDGYPATHKITNTSGWSGESHKTHDSLYWSRHGNKSAADHKKEAMTEFENALKKHHENRDNDMHREDFDMDGDLIEEGYKIPSNYAELAAKKKRRDRAMKNDDGSLKPVKLTKGWGDDGKSMKANYGKLTKEELEEVADTITEEEFEQLDELSKAKLGQYIKKAAGGDGLAGHAMEAGKEYGKDGTLFGKNMQKAIKRNRGIDKATDKLTKEELEDIAENITEEEFDQLDEISKEKLGQYIKKASDRKVTGALLQAHKYHGIEAGKEYRKRDQGLQKAVDRLTKEELENIAENITEEEFNQLDELSKNTLGSYVKKAAADVGKQNRLASRRPGMGHSLKGARREFQIDKAVDKLTKEEIEFLDQLNADELDEARGRPKRSTANQGFTIHPHTGEKLMHTNPAHMVRIERLIKNGALPKPKIEASQHIMQQLQKANLSMTGSGKVNFQDGSTHDIRGAHAAGIISKYRGLKPGEKEAFQKKIQQSHKHLMDELK